MSGTWLSTTTPANGFGNTYIKGFLDISGGNMLLRNGSVLVKESPITSIGGRVFVSSEGEVTTPNLSAPTSSFSLNQLHVGTTITTTTSESGHGTYVLDISGDTRIENTNTVTLNPPSTYTRINQSVIMSTPMNQYDQPSAAPPPTLIWNNDIYMRYLDSVHHVSPVTNPTTYTNTNTFTRPTLLTDVSMGKNWFMVQDASLNGRLCMEGSLTLGQPSFIKKGYALDISSQGIQGQVRINESIRGTAPSAHGGTVTLQHSDISGVSSMVFMSMSNAGNDYGSVAYYDTVYGTPYNYYKTTKSTASSALVLSCQKNAFMVSDPSSVDSVIIQAARSVIVDASSSSNTSVLGQTLIQPWGGKVGIGKTNPSPSFGLDISGGFICTEVSSTSDYRVKQNVRRLDTINISYVDGLRPYMYTNRRVGHEDIGFLAHELQDIYPFLVTGEKDGENLQSIQYTGLIAMLVAEVKELKRRVALTKG